MDDILHSHAHIPPSGVTEPVVARGSPALGTPIHPIEAISPEKITGKLV